MTVHPGAKRFRRVVLASATALLILTTFLSRADKQSKIGVQFIFTPSDPNVSALLLDTEQAEGLTTRWLSKAWLEYEQNSFVRDNWGLVSMIMTHSMDLMYESSLYYPRTYTPSMPQPNDRYFDESSRHRAPSSAGSHGDSIPLDFVVNSVAPALHIQAVVGDTLFRVMGWQGDTPTPPPKMPPHI